MDVDDSNDAEDVKVISEVDLSDDTSSTSENVRSSASSSRISYRRSSSNDGPSTSGYSSRFQQNRNYAQQQGQELKFMQNFDPQNSSRNHQKRKKRYGPDGRLIVYADDFEECDCVRPGCRGCHMPCKSCGDRRCGHECRVSRKWIYEAVEVEGTSIEYKNPHVSAFV